MSRPESKQLAYGRVANLIDSAIAEGWPEDASITVRVALEEIRDEMENRANRVAEDRR